MIIYGIGAIALLLFLVAPIRGLTFARLERVAPGSLAFTISNRKVFGNALATAAADTNLGRSATGLTTAPCVTADALGLSFWDNTPLQYVGSLDWSRIERLDVGELQTSYRRWSSSAIFLHVSMGEGTMMVPLLSPNGTREMSGSRRESAFLLERLEELRRESVTV
jgi:hypothetical protein